MAIRHLLRHGFGRTVAALLIGAAASAEALSLAVEHGEITTVLGIEAKPAVRHPIR